MSERKWVFEKATKKRAKLRMAIDGPSGSGKTYTGLLFATALADGGSIAVIDTERGSASKYADLFEFDVLELDNYHPQRYMEAIQAAEDASYDVLLIDSASHAWEGESGILDLHDKAVLAQRVANTWSAWKDVTPIHRKLIDKILQANLHVIVTMRTKTEWVLEQDSRGKQIPKRVGMQAVQRKGIEYEFDVVADMDVDHNLIVSKTRCHALSADTKQTVRLPGAKWFQTINDWLSDGAEEPERMRTRQETPVAQDNEASSPDKEEAKQVNGRHWIDREGVRGRLNEWLDRMAVTDSDVLTALGVEDIHDYAGSMKEARECIETWLDRQRTPQEASTGSAKPLTPEELMAELRAEADKGSTRNASQKQWMVVATCLGRLFPDDSAEVQEAKRHALTLQIFGVTSSTRLSGGQASALIEWAIAGGDGDDKWQPNPHAIKEAAAIVKLYEAEKGQTDMFDAEEAEQEELPY